MHPSFLGIDIGATTMKSAVVQADGTLLSQVKTISLGAQTDNNMLFDALSQSIEFALRTNNFDGIGIGSPGPLDDQNGIIFHSANFPLVKNAYLFTPVQAAWEKFSSSKENFCGNIFLQNDANCAALGLLYFSPSASNARKKNTREKNLAVYTLGTGVGGGLVYNGKLFTGYQGNAFEIGHTSCPDLAHLYHDPSLCFLNAQKCGCGAWDCLETFSSANGLCARYLSLLSPQERDIQKNITAKEIADLARRQNAAAKKVFQIAGLMLGYSLVNVVHLLNVETVIFTGGLASAEDLLRPPVEQVVQENMFAVFRERLSIEFVPAQEQNGIKGAAALCLDARF